MLSTTIKWAPGTMNSTRIRLASFFFFSFCKKKDAKLNKKKREVRWPGVEPGSAAWKATMLTVTPPTLEILQTLIESIRTAWHRMSTIDD